MKKLHLFKRTLLLFALIVGSLSVWAAAGDPQWSYTVVNGDASKLNTTAKTFTVDATHVFSYEGTTVAAGTSPSITVGKASNTYGIKFGESSSKYYSPVILSTSAFSDKAVTKVSLYLKHNGKKTGSLTVKQGDITIGTASTTLTSDWTTVTCSETKVGAGGTLVIQYEVAQAIYINKIEVWYSDISSDTWSVTYDANGATSGSVPTDDIEYDAENNSVTVLGNTGSLAKTGYTFDGWNTKADGSGTGYAAGASFEISSNTTLYAKWTVNSHNVTLPAADTYGSYTMSASNPVNYGTAVTLTYTPAPGYEEYRATWSVNGSPIVGNDFNMPDADVTVTVSVEEVKDYATLPFAFNGGLSDIEDTEGLTQEGLGSYNSSPKLKFDDTGDYMILKINEAPGILTFDIKGNSFSGGTFKVQVSADGESYSDVASYTTLSETTNEEIDDLASTVRYIKWIYTTKSSGNVALGNISLAKVRPIITLSTTSVEATTEETPGTIEVTYMNFSDIVADVAFYESDGVTPATYDWLEAEINASNNVAYTIAANTGEARTAYMKVYALDDNSNEVYSDLITFTQAKYLVPTHRLVTSIVPGRHYVFASGTDGAIYTMSNQKSTNRNAVSETAYDGKLSLDGETSTYEFVIGFDAESGYYTIYDNDAASTGYLYAAGGSDDNHLKTQAENNANGQWSITFDGSGVATIKANMSGRNWMRFNNGNTKLFSCYSSGQSDIYLYERISDTGSQDFTVNIASACTDGAKYYGTFSAPFAFTAPDGVTVAEIGLDNENKLNVQAYGAGDVVPANTGVMISSTSAGAKTFTSAEGGSSVLGSNNRLRPTNYGITAANMSDADDDCQFYRLTMHNGTQIGFWWGTENGAAFSIAANKAYLAVPSGVAARSFWFDEGETTAINAALMNNERMNNEVYNLNGQRVTQPTKGLYIVNGKKVMFK